MFDWIREKLNPAQPYIADEAGDNVPPSSNLSATVDAYNRVEIVNRGTNLIADSAAAIRMDVGEQLNFSNTPNRVRAKKLATLLNFRPNPYYNADVLKRNIFIDLILEGDAFLYYDGASLYNLPASRVEVVPDPVTYVREYKYAEKTFKPNEIIHIKENSASSVFTGTSRLDSAIESLNVLLSMTTFQKNFFDNSAVPGLVLTTPNPLSDRVKARILSQWATRFNPKTGGKKPMLIDGDFKLEPLSKYSFKELDFNESIGVQELKVLKALGVPPILLDSGNNANITPNTRLFYIQTVLPLYEKLVQALEVYFGYDIKPITQDVLALRPELRDMQAYITGLVNAGVITRNEAREMLRYSEHDESFADQLILPANIAGSAVDPSSGGAPSKDGNNG